MTTLLKSQHGNKHLTQREHFKQQPVHSCPGEYCSLIHVLDPNRDIINVKKKISIQSPRANKGTRGRLLKQNDREGRERALKILKRVVTKEELFGLEDSGDVTKLKIDGRICPGKKGFLSVPRESIERSKREHRVKFLELQDMEDQELGLANVWESGEGKGDEVDVYAGKTGESKCIQVCEMCFHTYRLLTKVTCLREKTILSATEDEVFGLSQMLQEDRPRGNDDDAICLSLSRKNTCVAPLPDLDLNKDWKATESNSQQGSNEKSNANRGTAVLERNDGRQNSSPLSPKNRMPITPNAQVKKMKRPRQSSMSHDETSRHIIRQETQMKKFAPDDKTEIPYCILSSTLRQPRQKANSQSGPNSRKAHARPKCNLVVCHDLFDTFERMQIYLSPFIEHFAGHKILLWNYAGQAYTKFSDTECLNNAFHTKCLIKLIDHVGIDGTNEFASNEPFYIMGHGQGGSIACLYAKSRQQPSLKGLFLVNPLSYVDTHFASVIHDCRNVFNCSPEERPDLPLYFYSRFLFSDGYLKKTPTALALNLYAAVHNPITLRGRIRLCDGALDNVDLRGIVNEVFAPIISLHGNDASLMRPLHAATFLQDRECCSTIQQAVYRKGGKRTVIVMTEGGHELFQEKKKTICMLIEQLLTGNVSSPQNVKNVNKSTDNNRGKQDNLEINDNTNQQKWSDLINFSQKTKDDGSDASKPPARHFRDETNVKHRDNGNRKIRSLEEHCINRPTNMLLDPENPTFERQKNSIYKPSAGSSIYPAPDEDRKTKEYMAWRLRRNRKRLTRFQRAAAIIQKTLRAFMAKTMIARLKRQTSALTIQRCYRGMLARFIFIEKRREIWASRFVQRMYRGRIGRKTSYFTRITKKSQIHIAKMWRGYVARKWVNRLLLRRNSAATDFQTLWRGCLALKLAGIMRLKRNSCIVIQRINRGRRGRQKADKEREKYLFSRSQSRGIEIGRQMLSQHKSQATKLQSELSILSQEKKILEEKVKFITQEITNFQETLTTLEKSMQEICLIEVDLKSSKFDSSRAKADISIRQKKSCLDEEFSSLLMKITNRKNQLISVEEKLSQFQQNKEQKEKALRILERSLVSLLETQEIELAEIRRRQDTKEDLALNRKTQKSSKEQHRDSENMQMKQRSTLDRQKTAQLMNSTETMMKFGFTSMSMTYFTALNMVRTMKDISTQEVGNLSNIKVSHDDAQGLGMKKQSDLYTRSTDSPVLNWEVDHVIQWLKALSLSQYGDSFRDGSIDGPFLFELTDDDLMNVLGVEHKLHRKKIMFGIAQLQEMSTKINEDRDDTIGFDGSLDLNAALSRAPVGSPEEPASLSPPPISSVQKKKVELPLSLEDLSRWVRNQKYSLIKEALSSLPSTKFDASNVRVQFMENMGTIYETLVTAKLFHINKNDEHGNTLMHIAAQNGNLRIARLLIQKGVNPNHQNKQGQTPGHFAVAYQFYDFASWLFEEKGGGGDDLMLNMYGLGPYDGISDEE